MTTTPTLPPPDPYAVELALAAALAEITQAQDTQIVQAWAQAWGSVSSELLDTLTVILADAKKVNTASVVRYQRLNTVLGHIANHLDDLAKALGVTITNDLNDVVQRAEVGTRELIAAQRLLHDEQRGFPVRRVPTPAMQAIVRRTTEQVTSQLQPLADDTYTMILHELTKGTAAGDSPRQTAARMVNRAEDMHNFGRSRALNIARTETLDAYRAGGQATEQQYPDLIAEWVWAAHLGPRTCRSCLSMHGRTFPLDVPGPEDHPQGRCSRIPVVLEDDGSVDTSWLPDAAAHFENLSEAEQRAILGNAGYEAWKRGDFPIEVWTKHRENQGWRDSQVPAAPGDPAGGTVGGTQNVPGGGSGGNPPSGGGPAGPGGPDDPLDAMADLAHMTVTLPDSRRTHILDGDHSGGGHRYGTTPTIVDRPKTWFPEQWDDQKILDAIDSIATDPIVAKWANEARPFLNAYGEIDGVRIKVRVSPNGSILTAHPIDGAGVYSVRLKKDGTVTDPKEIPYGRSREVSW